MADTRAHFLRSFLPCTASQASLAAAQRAPLPPHRQRSDFLHGFFGRGAHSSAAAPRGAGAEGWASAPPGGASGEGGPDVEKRAWIDFVLAAGAPRPRARLALPRAAAVGPAGLPCPAYPSDHLALVLEFAW